MGHSAPLQHEAAWSLLLQHAWQSLGQQAICSLLCCSQGMVTILHSSCEGLLSVHVRNKGGGPLSSPPSDIQDYVRQYVQQITRTRQLRKWLSQWLSRHHAVVRELILHDDDDDDDDAQQGHCTLAEATNTPETASVSVSVSGLHAAVQQQLLRLLQRLAPCGSAAPPLLPSHTAAALSTLTRFDWEFSSSCRPKPIIRAFVQLRGLRDVRLRCIDSGSGSACFDGLAPAVQHLSGLTALHLQHFSISKAGLRKLPASLQHLTLGPPLPRFFEQATRHQQLALRHLTSLHTLQLHTLKGCDELPCALTALRVQHCSALPLLPLKCLQQLSISDDAPESLLTQLCNMPQLQELALTFKVWSLSHTGCKALQQLPLKALQCTLPADQLELVGQWKQLTSLQLQVEAACSSTVQLQLAPELAQLTALEHLSLKVLAQPLRQGQWPVSAAQHHRLSQPAASFALAAAIHSLPALKSLQAEGLGLDDAAPCAQLEAAASSTGEVLGIGVGARAAAVAASSKPPVTASRPCVRVLVQTEC